MILIAIDFLLRHGSALGPGISRPATLYNQRMRPGKCTINYIALKMKKIYLI
jgi:hypothetical protein